MPVKTHLVRRGLAAVIDYFFIASIYVAGERLLDVPVYCALGCVVMLMSVAAWFIYFVGIESSYGRTAGKALFDLMVERLDGKPLSWLDCLLRHLADPIDFLFIGGPAILAVKLSSRGQRLGDMLADTHVVLIS